MRTIPIVVCIDVEPEDREIELLPKDWEGFERLTEFLNGSRPQLERFTGAPAYFSWFLRMDPQIDHVYGSAAWVARRYREVILRLERAGDEIGLHTHAWRWDQNAARWIIDHGNPSWVNHCLQVSFEAYRNAFGRSCPCFRFGDRWMQNETMGALEALGVKYDLTIEPGMKQNPGLVSEELHTGFIPDYSRVPRRPYKPSRRDFRKESRTDSRELWLLPLSTARHLGRFAELKRVALRLGVDLQWRHETSQLNLAMKSWRFSELINNLLADIEKPYLAPVLRSDIGVNSWSMANLQNNLTTLISHRFAESFRFVRPAEAIEILSSSE
jgi:hypothetical protein